MYIVPTVLYTYLMIFLNMTKLYLLYIYIYLTTYQNMENIHYMGEKST